MLALLLLVATLASPQPSPAPSASAGPLKEIIRVHSTTLCDDFDTHVNLAIGSATRNDLSLAGLISNLSSPRIGDDLSDNGLKRHKAIVMLVNYADALTAEWKSGEAEVRRLRELAENASNADQKVAIKASADALGGVLWRQRKIARDLDGFVAYLYAEEMLWGDHTQVQAAMALDPETNPGSAVLEERQRLRQDDINGREAQVWTPLPGEFNGPPDDYALTKGAARDFRESLPGILSDESNAATNIVKAAGHC
ncbi:MAG: hypothetical protein ABI282_07190 [Candidatus Baltobacteraceae bacterium]